MELVIAVGIFALMTGLIAGIYLAFSRLQTESRASQRLLNDSQYALEMMAREIRNNMIFDFDPSAGDCAFYLGESYSNCILLLREDGLLTAFTVNNGALYHVILNCNIDYTSCQLWEPSPSSFTILLSPASNKISVDELDFYIKPNINPYKGCGQIEDYPDCDYHPRATIRLQVSYASNRTIEQVSQNFQTTVSSRIYRR